MVDFFSKSLLLVALASGVSASGSQEVPFYDVGDTATNTVVTSVPLVVKDPVATALLQAQHEREIRAVVLYSPAAADSAEREFRSYMARLREDFLKDLTEEYGQSRIEKGLERTPKWISLVDRFREKYTGTPKLFRYVPYWAQGRSDEHLLTEWIGYMRRTMDRPVRADRLPNERVGSTVRMVTVPTLDTEVQLDHLDRYGVLTPLDNIVTLSQAAAEMKDAFPEDDRYIADFLKRFLEPNCVFDEELTRLARGRRVDSLIVADDYAAGETLVRVGQVVDAKAKAALDELRKQLPEEPPLEAPAPGAKDRTDERAWMVWVVGGVGGVAMLVTFGMLARRRTTESSMPRIAHPRRQAISTRLPAKIPGSEGRAAQTLGRMEGESEREWRERALAAEEKAEKAKALAKSSVANALKDKVVEHLSNQRDELIDHQQSAAEQMAGLEARLERIQGPLSERLRAYEQRIAELEEELAVKDEENRALIQAKIHNLRERMAAEKAGRRPRVFDLN